MNVLVAELSSLLRASLPEISLIEINSKLPVPPPNPLANTVPVLIPLAQPAVTLKVTGEKVVVVVGATVVVVGAAVVVVVVGAAVVVVVVGAVVVVVVVGEQSEQLVDIVQVVPQSYSPNKASTGLFITINDPPLIQWFLVLVTVVRFNVCSVPSQFVIL
jgi:hypothetical protein